jgi:S1-C subfamily serine protease
MQVTMKNNRIKIISLLLSIFLITTACFSTRTLQQLGEQVQSTLEAQQQNPPAEPTPRPPSTYAPPSSQSLPPLVPAESIIAQEGTLEALYQHVNPGVVWILFSGSTGTGQGSGFVYDKQGHIITNYHVAGQAQNLEVDFPSGLKVPATLVGIDTDSDIAVIKVDVPEDQLTVLPLGDSDKALVGQPVVAIGNPYGLAGTMTLGIVSAHGRVLDSIRTNPDGTNFAAGDLIQTDALINPGNSGGPLLNMKGEVIGVNRAIETAGTSITGDPVNTGIGFAISSNIVRKVVPSLIEKGTYDYPYLGLSALNHLSLSMATELGLNQSIGAYVTTVVPGGPADKAGVKAGNQPSSIRNLFAGGDLITAVDGKQIKEFSELLSYMALHKEPGDVIRLTVQRGTQEVTLDVTLGKRP